MPTFHQIAMPVCILCCKGQSASELLCQHGSPGGVLSGQGSRELEPARWLAPGGVAMRPSTLKQARPEPGDFAKFSKSTAGLQLPGLPGQEGRAASSVKGRPTGRLPLAHRVASSKRLEGASPRDDPATKSH